MTHKSILSASKAGWGGLVKGSAMHVYEGLGSIAQKSDLSETNGIRRKLVWR